ncbi:MAG: glycosyltransferase [Candidatus Kapabacteria bacterium]|nr:glycosyltransferase [Candidatus Kapabacteria bacterium]
MEHTSSLILPGNASPDDVTVWKRNAEPVTKPRISIILPMLHEEKLIAKTLAAFPEPLCREFNVEIVVSDGGSTDMSVAIASETADVVITHTAARRQTIAEGRNRGAEAASGETLVFINADTTPAEPRVFLQIIAEWTQRQGKYASAAALACPVEVTPSERKWSDVLFHNFFNNYLKVLSLLGFGVGRGECQIIRTAAFHAVQGYNAHLAAGEDFDLLQRIAKSETIALANELLVYESPRRYRTFGYMRILGQWFMNWVGATFLQKSISKEWTPVR